MKHTVVILCMCLSVCSSPGQEGLYDGAWLAQAKERIERIRMGPLRVRVTEGGAPVEGAEVRIEMTRHAFPFGSAVTAGRLVSDPSADGEHYRQLVTRLFNRVVFENDLKWPAWEGEWGEDFRRAQTREAIAWLHARGISVRGHCLAWPGWQHLPQSLRTLEQDPQALRRRVREHVLEQAGALRGLVCEWDVVNETYWNHDLQDILGRGVMVEWFKAAREADPLARLFINDARIVAFGSLEPEHKQFYFDEVKFLVDEGAPLDGIGLQCHFREDSLTRPEEALAMLDRFAGFGLDLAVTEFDIHAAEEEIQARYMHDFLHIAFSHPAVTQFIMWGFWEGQIYKTERALYRSDWSPKPAAEVFEKLVLDTWWTRERGITSEDGVYETRGFLGSYRVEVEHGNRTRAATCAVDAGGTVVELDLSRDPAVGQDEGP